MRKTIQGYVQVAYRKEFRRFWLGMMISRAGDAFTVVALSWVVLDIAGPLQLGLVLMCFGLPRIVSDPVAGRLLETFQPRTLLAVDNSARGLLIAVVPVLLWLHHLAVADLYAIAFVSALLSAVTEVAESALVPRLVADEQLDAAILLGLAAFVWGPYYVFDRTLVQRLVPARLRSRVFGARMTISSLGFPLGSAIGGALLGAFGVPTVILAIACAYAALGLLPLLALRNMDLAGADRRVQISSTAE